MRPHFAPKYARAVLVYKINIFIFFDMPLFPDFFLAHISDQISNDIILLESLSYGKVENMDKKQRKNRIKHILAALENNAGGGPSSKPVNPPASAFLPAGNIYPEKDLPPLNILKAEIFSKSGTKDLASGVEAIHSDVLEEETPKGTRQLAYRRLKGADGRFMIEEAVENFLGEKRSLPQSRLAVVEIETGRTLDLNRFLPVGCSFSPSQLLKLKVEFDRRQRRLKSEFFPVNLKAYQGADVEGDFYFNREVGRIAYGDLTAAGSLLILFHEIVHSWQFAFQGMTAENEFSKLYTFLSHHLNKLGARMEEHKRQTISDENLSCFIGNARDRLGERGIALDTNSIVNKGQLPSDKSITFTARSGQKFFFKSHAFVEALKDYMWVERDAWAYSIKVIRLLRKRGFELEANLRNLQNVQAFIYPHLENYQASIQSHIEMGSGTIRFSAKRIKTAMK